MSSLTVKAVEAATLSAWPALRVAHDGLWIWRWSKGYTKRANAMHCLDPADGENAAERIAHFARLSVRNGIDPVFRVTPLTAPAIVAALDRLNWRTLDQSLVLGMEMPSTDWASPYHSTLYEPGDPDWVRAQAVLNGFDAGRADTLRQIALSIAGPARGIVAFDSDGHPAASALAAVCNGIGVYLCVVTRPDLRGSGYGRAVMAAALAWTRDEGAGQAAIQVLADNRVAVGLYASLGFSELYQYNYRMPPESVA